MCPEKLRESLEKKFGELLDYEKNAFLYAWSCRYGLPGPAWVREKRRSIEAHVNRWTPEELKRATTTYGWTALGPDDAFLPSHALALADSRHMATIVQCTSALPAAAVGRSETLSFCPLDCADASREIIGGAWRTRDLHDCIEEWPEDVDGEKILAHFDYVEGAEDPWKLVGVLDDPWGLWRRVRARCIGLSFADFDAASLRRSRGKPEALRRARGTWSWLRAFGTRGPSCLRAFGTSGPLTRPAWLRLRAAGSLPPPLSMTAASSASASRRASGVIPKALPLSSRPQSSTLFAALCRSPRTSPC